MTRMKPRLVFALIVTTVGIGAFAAPALDSVKGGAYRADPDHTQVSFSISHFGFTRYTGIFSGASGTLKWDPAHPAQSSLDVKIPLDSVVTTSSKLTGELKGEQWFDAAHFPQAMFVSTRVSVDSSGTLTINGNFTLHGITKPVTLTARLVGAGVNPIDKMYTAGFEAHGTIKRTDFGVSQYAPALGDEVELLIAGAFEIPG
jgi:polyisoprenoid-binding protein YceI